MACSTTPVTNSKRVPQVIQSIGQALFGKGGSAMDSFDNDSENDSDDSFQDESDGSTHFAFNSRQSSDRASDAQKNADELVAQEEKEKKRVEKRKAKKKRKKQKKKQEKNSENKLSESEGKENRIHRPMSTAGSDEEFLDPTSAFVESAVSKNKKGSSTTAGNTETKRKVKKNAQRDNENEKDPKVEESERLAGKANMLASYEHFDKAVEYCTKAINLVPKDYRIYGNRSFCYSRLGDFRRALEDAEKTIALQPHGPKGYFRKGVALVGLKVYQEAEKAFEEVLKLDTECIDATQELFNVRVLRLREMGFPDTQAKYAIAKFASVEAAVEGLVHSNGEAVHLKTEVEDLDEIYMSDDEEYPEQMWNDTAPVTNTIPKIVEASPIPKSAIDPKMDASNPSKCCSLWIGNVNAKITDTVLHNLFSKYGPLKSKIFVKPEKFCAFVNYQNHSSAAQAMAKLQSYKIEGTELLIRFPDNAVSDPHQPIILKKKSPNTSVTSTTTTSVAAAAAKPLQLNQKLSGPVNGDECYFWRTTGCSFGSKCHYNHVPEHKGVDRKPYHK